MWTRKQLLPGALIVVTSLCAMAQSEDQIPSVRIVECDPSGSVALARAEPLYVRVSYRSSRRLRFRAAGYAGGSEMGGAHNIMPPYPAGSGEVLTWISFDRQTVIDEVRVVVKDEDWKPVTTVSLPLTARWTGVRSANRRALPDWVARLRAAENDVSDAEQAAARQDDGPWGMIFFQLIGWSIPAYIVLQVYLARSSSGRWRTAALLPMAVVVPLVGFTVFAFIAGSNLFPLALLFLTPLLFMYLLAVLVARMLFSRAA